MERARLGVGPPETSTVKTRRWIPRRPGGRAPDAVALERPGWTGRGREGADGPEGWSGRGLGNHQARPG